MALKNGCQKTCRGREHWALVKLLCQMFSNGKEVDNCINESCESVSSECTSKNKVEKYNELIVVEKEE